MSDTKFKKLVYAFYLQVKRFSSNLIPFDNDLIFTEKRYSVKGSVGIFCNAF